MAKGRLRELALKRVLPSQLDARAEQRRPASERCYCVQTCLAPQPKFQRASTHRRLRGAACSHLCSWLCSKGGADARACWHAAALAVRRGPRASWGTGRGNRNSMKISARRDGDHARRAGLARPPDVHHRSRRCPLVVGVTAVDFRSYFSGCQLLRASLREVRRLRDLEAVQTRCGEARIWR